MFKVKEMMVVGYEMKSACGKMIRKLIVCENVEQYLIVKARIEDAGYTLIRFDEMYMARDVLR